MPNDVAIVGYDDVVFAELASVPLTSVRQPIYELGFNAAKLLLNEVAKGSKHKHERLIFKPELVVRQSTVGRAHAVVGTSGGDVPLAATGSQN